MSGFEFATCDKNMAISFLKKLYPNGKVNEQTCALIMPFITSDIVRIQDPDFHKPSQVVAGKNWSENKEEREKISAIFKDFHESMLA